MCNGKDYNNQSGAAYGLALVYEQSDIPDSTAKYYKLAYAMNDSMHAQKATEEVERMQAMYDYTRHQEAARREEKKATFRAQIIWICIGLIILLCIVGYIIYEESARKRKDIEQKYLSSLDIIMQARQDIAKLEAHKIENSELIAEKKQLIHKQKDYLKTLSEESIIYKQFLIKGQEPTLQELDQIKEQVFELFPDFCSFMSTHEKMLNDKEYKTCILVRAGFNPKSISNMLGVGPSYISNIRSEMLQILFGKAGTPKDFDKLLRNIC
jgi:CHASE3 domain sensor protein